MAATRRLIDIPYSPDQAFEFTYVTSTGPSANKTHRLIEIEDSLNPFMTSYLSICLFVGNERTIGLPRVGLIYTIWPHAGHKDDDPLQFAQAFIFPFLFFFFFIFINI